MRSDKYDYTVEGAVPEKDLVPRYYSSAQIFIATLLGGLISGVLLMAKNFKFWGEYDKARTTWFYGLMGAVVFCIAALLVPDAVPDAVWAAVPPAVIGVLVDKYQKKTLTEFVNSKTGMPQSNWKVAGYSVLGLIAILVLFLFIAVVLDSFYPGLLPDVDTSAK